MNPRRCTCDDFTDAPCPTHGYGELDCWCGHRFPAPIVAKARMIVTCQVCQRRYEGVEDCANGHWSCAIEPGTVYNASLTNAEQTERLRPGRWRDTANWYQRAYLKETR